MSAPTGDPRVTADMNEMLGRELGRNEYGKPYFSWRWSEDLFWPATATGRMLTNETKVLTPIIGAPHKFDLAPIRLPESDAPFAERYSDPRRCLNCGMWPDHPNHAPMHDFHVEHPDNMTSLGPVCQICGEFESHLSHNVYSIMQRPQPEYKRDRQYRKRDTWVICKWMTPWELILGPGRGYTSIMHGQQQGTDRAPTQEAVVAAWNRQFPGAPFPAKGWRVPTDAFLPNKEDPEWEKSPFGNQTPNRQDTERFIQRVRFQTSRSFSEVEREMNAETAARERVVDLEFGDVCRDAFPAFLNPKQGSRGNFVSFPWTKLDRAR